VTRSSATSWTRSKAASGCPTRTSRGRSSSVAIERIHELENELGCFFDRNPDGTVHQKAFAGQTFDRTVHKGDLTGIEIINRLAEQVWARGIGRLEEHRAVEFVKNEAGDALAGVLMIDVRTGEFVFVQAQAVLLADRRRADDVQVPHAFGRQDCDGMAMALRAGSHAARHGDGAVHPTVSSPAPSRA
jgi:fumarate reductase flavoprotein subunit